MGGTRGCWVTQSIHILNDLGMFTRPLMTIIYQVYTSRAYNTTLVKRENPRFVRGFFVASRHYRYPMIDHKIK
jgi:hypothetical protein